MRGEENRDVEELKAELETKEKKIQKLSKKYSDLWWFLM